MRPWRWSVIMRSSTVRMRTMPRYSWWSSSGLGATWAGASGRRVEGVATLVLVSKGVDGDPGGDPGVEEEAVGPVDRDHVRGGGAGERVDERAEAVAAPQAGLGAKGGAAALAGLAVGGVEHEHGAHLAQHREAA